MSRTIHIIGAGLAGLAAALKLSQGGARVILHEATAQAGGRCRSYYDHGIGLTIDNGNHLLLSGNRAAMEFLTIVGAQDRLLGPETAEFPFIDLRSKLRWMLRLGNGRLPLWVLDKERRVPDTEIKDYAPLAAMLFAPRDKTVGEVIKCNGILYDRLVQPLLLAALNIDVPHASAGLAATIIRQTLGKGGAACRPLVAREGLAHALIEPALATLHKRGVTVVFNHELRALIRGEQEITGLSFADGQVTLASVDRVILAVPPWIAANLLPGLRAPDQFRGIFNVHYRHAPPAGAQPITGVIGGTAEWVFAFPDRLSVTVSNGDRLMTEPREQVAQRIWLEVAEVVGISDPMPAWQIVRERRATFAATPEQDKKRPKTATAFRNLLLAGDWTDTGLPSTIEGAIRSGYRAAALAA